MKKFISVILIIVAAFLLCSCGKIGTTSSADEYDWTLIDSLYYYFKQDTKDMLLLLSPNAAPYNIKEIKSKAENINFLASAMVKELESMPDESNMTNKDCIIRSTEGCNRLVQDTFNPDNRSSNRSSLEIQFDEASDAAAIATAQTLINYNFAILDSAFGDISEEARISRDKLKDMCSSVQVKEYIVLPDTQSEN